MVRLTDHRVNEDRRTFRCVMCCLGAVEENAIEEKCKRRGNDGEAEVCNRCIYRNSSHCATNYPFAPLCSLNICQ